MSEDCRASQANDQEFQRSCLTVIWFNVVDSHIKIAATKQMMKL
jgi:hypothetical protein